MNGRSWRSANALLLAWIVFVVLNDLSRSWQLEVLFLLALIPLVLLTFFGLWLLVFLLMTRRWVQTIILVAAWPVIAALPLFDIGDRIWGGISLERNKQDYQEIISQVGGLPQQGTHKGHDYWIERTAPKLVYFQRASFLLDGVGFVYDAADTLPLEDPNSAIGGVGGYRDCIRLERSWYRCWFS